MTLKKPLATLKNAIGIAEVRSEVLLATAGSWDGTTYPEYPRSAPMISVLRISMPPKPLRLAHRSAQQSRRAPHCRRSPT